MTSPQGQLVDAHHGDRAAVDGDEELLGGAFGDGSGMAGVISPKRALAVIMPMGPQITSAHLQFTTTGFSPVAAASAPALRHGGGGGGVGADGDDLGGEGGGFELGHQGGAHFAPWPSMTRIFSAAWEGSLSIGTITPGSPPLRCG